MRVIRQKTDGTIERLTCETQEAAEQQAVAWMADVETQAVRIVKTLSILPVVAFGQWREDEPPKIH